MESAPAQREVVECPRRFRGHSHPNKPSSRNRCVAHEKLEPSKIFHCVHESAHRKPQTQAAPTPRQPRAQSSKQQSSKTQAAPHSIQGVRGHQTHTNQALKLGSVKTTKCGSTGTSSSQHDRETSEPSAQKHYPQTPSTRHGETPTQSDGRTESQRKHR